MVNYRCALRAHRFSEFNKFAIILMMEQCEEDMQKKPKNRNETEQKGKTIKSAFSSTKRQAHIQSRSKHDGS